MGIQSDPNMGILEILVLKMGILGILIILGLFEISAFFIMFGVFHIFEILGKTKERIKNHKEIQGC